MAPVNSTQSADATPTGWRIEQAGNLGTFRGGNGFPLAYQGKRTGDYPFFKVSDMNTPGNEVFMKRAVHHVSDSTRRMLGATVFPAGAIVFAKVGAAVFLERKRILAQPSCIDNNMAAFTLDSGQLDLRFTHHLLEATKLSALVATTALPSLNGKTLSAMPILVPPLSQQQAIARALGDVDALLERLDQLIAKKRDLRIAVMQQLLSGETRLPGFNDPWEERVLGEHVRFLKNGVNPRADLHREGHVRYLHYGDIHSSMVPLLDIGVAKMPRLPVTMAHRLDRLEDGDLVFVDASEDLTGVGKSVEISGAHGLELVSGLHTIAARFDKNVLADGFKGYLQFCSPFRDQLARLAQGTKVFATTRLHIASVMMKLPAIAEQEAIANVLSESQRELLALEALRKKTTDVKLAMMQDLLTGKTRIHITGGSNG